MKDFQKNLWMIRVEIHLSFWLSKEHAFNFQHTNAAKYQFLLNNLVPFFKISLIY